MLEPQWKERMKERSKQEEEKEDKKTNKLMGGAADQQINQPILYM